MLAQPAIAAMPARLPVSVIDRLMLRPSPPYTALAVETARPIAEVPLASIEVCFMPSMVSGSIAFRSEAAIGVLLPPVIAAIMSPTDLPAAAGSPEFCAALARSPAACMRWAIAAMLLPSMLTVAPSGVWMVMLPAPPAAPSRPAPMRDGMIAASTAPTTIPRTMPQTTTTAV